MGDDLVLVKLSYGNNVARWVSNCEYQFWDGIETITALPILDKTFSFGYGLKNVEQRIYQPTLSNLRIIDPGGRADDFRGIDWFGHEITVYEGKNTDDLASLVERNTSINGDIASYDDVSTTFKVLPLTEKLNQNVQTEYYSGTNDDTIDVTLKPLNFGLNFNVQAKIIGETFTSNDHWSLHYVLYQLYDGSANIHKIDHILSGSAVVFSGVGYSNALSQDLRAGFNLDMNGVTYDAGTGIVLLYQFLFDRPDKDVIGMKMVTTGGNTPQFGDYITFSNGFTGRFLQFYFDDPVDDYMVLVRDNDVALPLLNNTFVANVNPPGGTAVTGTVTEDAFVWSTFYEGTDVLAGDVRFWTEGASVRQGDFGPESVLHSLFTRVVLPDEIDAPKLAQFDIDAPWDIGTHIDSRETSLEAVAKIYPAGVILGYGGGASPKVEIQTLKEPNATADHVIKNIKKGTLRRIRTSKAAWRVTVEGLWNHSPISNEFERGNVFGPANPDYVKRDKTDYQASRQASDINIFNAQKIPHELNYKSRIQDVVHLQLYANFLFNLFKVSRSTYTVTIVNQNHLFKVGDTANIGEERFPFNGPNGKNSIVIQVVERPAMKETDLVLWH